MQLVQSSHMSSTSILSHSPNGPSSRRFSAPNIGVDSDQGLEKAFKSLRFSDFTRVVMIPSRHECLAPGMNLWWTPQDYHSFKQMRIQESMSGIDLISFNFQTKHAQDELVDLRILIVSNESVLSSGLTRNLATALAQYQIELNGNNDNDNHITNHPPFQRVRSSVTQVTHNSKDYALAVQSSSSGLQYNVILFDSGRRRLSPKQELELANRQRHNTTAAELEREDKQAGSYVVSSCNSYLVKPDNGSSLSTSVNVSTLLLNDTSDSSDVPCDENHLLRKIIKSGTALSYICEDPCLPSPVEEWDDHTRHRGASASQPLAIPLPSTSYSSFSSSPTSSPSCSPLNSISSSPGRGSGTSVSSQLWQRRSSIPPPQRVSTSYMPLSSLFEVEPPVLPPPPPPQYSLLRDHADVVLEHTPLSSLAPALHGGGYTDTSSVQMSLSCSPPPPPLSIPPPLPSPAHVPLFNTHCGDSAPSSHRILAVEDWLRLFRITATRTAASSSSSSSAAEENDLSRVRPVSPEVEEEVPKRRLSLSLREESSQLS